MYWINQYQFFILGGVLLVGFVIGGFFLTKVSKKIKILFGGGNGAGETDLQQEILRRLTKTEMWLEDLKPRLEILEKIAKTSIQKTGFLRFNPFPGTGGENSFVIALLDKEDNGFLLSSLYTREGVRIYAKQIEKGKPKHPLSEEEMKVLGETINK